MRLLPRNNADVAAVSVGITSTSVGLESVEVFPNPVDQQFSIHLQLEEAQQLGIKLYDLQGRVVQILSPRVLFSPGAHQWTYHLYHHLPKGIYTLVLDNGREVETVRLMKQ